MKKIEELLIEWSKSSGVKGAAFTALKKIVMDEIKESNKQYEALSKDYEKLARSEDRTRMENAMQYNRLRVLNKAATNYCIQYDNDGKEISASEFKEKWNKEHGTSL